MRKSIYLLLVVFLFFFLDCDDHEKSESKEKKEVNRTVLFYMGGKNNLSGETYEKVEAIRQGWDDSVRGNLLIYHAPDNANPSLLELTSENGKNILKTVEEYEEENSAEKKVFQRVLNDVMELYPAPSYGLVLFSHASGWLPAKTLTKPRSIVQDLGVEMEFLDFVSAIPDNSLDFIVFEACFMAGIEVLYELKDKTKYIVASSAEILSPGFTEIYKEKINYLFESTPDLEAFAGNAFNYFNGRSGNDCSATFSIVKTAGLDNLAQLIAENIDISREVDIEQIQHFDRYSTYKLFFDFEDYYSLLLKDHGSIGRLSRILEDCILYKSATASFMPLSNGFVIDKHSGITSYILQDKFPYLNLEYTKLKWYKKVFQNALSSGS